MLSLRPWASYLIFKPQIPHLGGNSRSCVVWAFLESRTDTRLIQMANPEVWFQGKRMKWWEGWRHFVVVSASTAQLYVYCWLPHTSGLRAHVYRHLRNPGSWESGRLCSRRLSAALSHLCEGGFCSVCWMNSRVQRLRRSPNIYCFFSSFTPALH